MRRMKIIASIALSAASAFLLILSFTPAAGGAPGMFQAFWDDDPDLPPRFVPPRNTEFSKEEFMTRRAEGIALKRGIGKDTPFDPQARPAALRQMELQEEFVASMPQSNLKDALLAPWVSLGPAPIPNGQTVGVTTPVSGRTIAIAVHPTNPNIVYVGAAQGGLYRSTNGGTNWTALMDGELSLAIGAIAVAPSSKTNARAWNGSWTRSARCSVKLPGMLNGNSAGVTSTAAAPAKSTGAGGSTATARSGAAAHATKRRRAMSSFIV